MLGLTADVGISGCDDVRTRRSADVIVVVGI